MIDKQTNNKEERGIEMRKETTNKPKKEPFLILTRTKFENKSRRRITNILKKNSQENSKDQKNTQTKNSNKASEAKHKENEHSTKIPATKCILQNCKQQQQRFKKTREREAQKAPWLGHMPRPHDGAAVSEGKAWQQERRGQQTRSAWSRDHSHC